MRTTLTLDDDLFHELRELARRTDTPFKQVVNAVLRSGLGNHVKPSPELPRFRVEAKPCGFRAGIDVLRLNQLNDELEVEDFARNPATGATRE